MKTQFFLQSSCQAEPVEADLKINNPERSRWVVTSNRTSIELSLRRTLHQLVLLLSFSCLIVLSAHAQLMKQKETFTHADTLRGSLNPNRDWWDVLRYDITVKPDFEKKEIEGKVVISYRSNLVYKQKKGTRNNNALKLALGIDSIKKMQIDLQAPLIIDSISCIDSLVVGTHSKMRFEGIASTLLTFKQVNNIVEINIKGGHAGKLDILHNVDSIIIYYHGKPREAKTPPWDGGWIWKKDKNGNPWMSVAVQGLGASAWYPCKDYQGDEPDNGASLTMIVPDTLVAVANGRLNSKSQIPNSKLVSYKWEVKNPINNYCIVPYIGKYVNFTDTLMGEKGKLDLSYWVLDYNLDKAKEQFKQVKPMLRAFEYWFGPYPFYEDSYKLVDAPHLGMEHQSAVAYGNQYKNGYLGMDRSASGWGKKWDFIIIHESGHEWFANNITTNDIADMWVHETFTTYSETLFTEYYYGLQAGNEYNYGQRRNIRNDVPIIGPYGVNKEGSGDMYDKGSNMIHSIRHAMKDDKKFRQILRGLNKTFYHKTVNTKDVEDYISKQAGFNFQKVFDQYLRTTQVPVLEYYFADEGKKLHYRYTNCISGFNLPLVLPTVNNESWVIKPSEQWQVSSTLSTIPIADLTKSLEKLFYIKLKEVITP